MRLTRSLAFVALFAATLCAQVQSVTTTLQGGNGQKGAMFNVNNISAGTITVTHVSQNFLAAGTATMQVYTKAGSYVGSEALPANWTLLGTVSGVVHGGAGVAVAIPLTLNVAMAAGTTQAFYVTATTATASNVAYTNGTAVLPVATTAGSVVAAASDANIQFVCGVGNVYPFGGTFGGPTPGGAGRCFNGKIHYVVGNQTSPLWQTNSATAYMDFDFILASPVSGAVATKCIGAPVNACADSFGLPADLALNMAPIVDTASGGIGISATTAVNLDLTGGLIWLLNAFIPLGPASGTCPLFFNAFPGILSAQEVVIDPTSAIGITLSQACQMTGIAGTGTLTLPNADDTAYLVNLLGSPLCNTAGVGYYGTTYTQMVVSTNGIIFPGIAGNNGWVPAAATAMTNPGSFGVWADWQSNANPAASIVLTNNTVFGGFDVTYTNIPYWGTTVNSTFKVCLDPIGPRLEGLTGLGVDPTVGANTMLFMSKGPGATDPLATAFTLGGLGTTAVNTDMLYAIGAGAPALAGGANNLWFSFNMTGGVDWAGL